MTSGDVLREARERKGYDLTTVARRLRIRPDILRAIEASDFTSMPPRGYTRNMVNAYARFLGLNPTEIVDKYLEEAYAYQVEKARGSAPSSGFVMDGGQRRPRLGARSNRNASVGEGKPARAKRTSYDAEASEDPYPVRMTEGGRHLYDDRTRFAHDGYGITRGRADRGDGTESDFLSHHSSYSSYPANDPLADSSWGSRRGQRAIRVGQTPMQYSAPRIPSFLRSRGVLIGAIALVILILIIIVFTVTGNGGDSQSDDVSQLPVSGISDTTGTSDDEASEETQVEIAPTSARVVYSVSSGDDCYVEFYTDGEMSSAELLSGPVQETVEVTGTWTVTTWSPDTIKVTVDSEEVELKSDSEYGGMYSYTVDFAQVLADWNSTHGSKDAQRQAAVASANNAAEQASKAAAAEESESADAAESSSADGQ